MSLQTRLAVLAAVLLSQTLVFAHFYPRPPTVISDNIRYELPAVGLIEGEGLSLPRSAIDDPEVRGWVCTRHPTACSEDRNPVALYPPGYTLFIAAVYTVTGRSLTALLMVQLVLLWALFVLLEQVAFRMLGRAGWWLVMAVAFTYPFIARQATFIMSDHLHVVLLFSAMAALVLLRPGPARAALFAAALAAATLVRPYSIVAMLLLLAWPGLWSEPAQRRREWPVALVIGFLPFALWAARNFYWFGKFIPLTTSGLGATLYTIMLEGQHHSIYSGEAAWMEQQLFRFGDPLAWGPNHQLQAVAVEWMRQHPLTAVGVVLAHAPKVWISLGAEGQGMTLRALPLALYLGGLLLAGLAGAWCVRRQRRWWAILAVLFSYWGFLLTGAEARRTLPLRLLLLLLAGAAVDAWVARRRAQRPAQRLESSSS